MHSNTLVLSGVTSITCNVTICILQNNIKPDCFSTHLLRCLLASRHLLLELHDELLIAGEEIPPREYNSLFGFTQIELLLTYIEAGRSIKQMAHLDHEYDTALAVSAMQ